LPILTSFARTKTTACRRAHIVATLVASAHCPALANYQGKRRRSPTWFEGTNTGHENAEGMACVGDRLTAQLGIYLLV
jgi:hypothetical protein